MRQLTILLSVVLCQHTSIGLSPEVGTEWEKIEGLKAKQCDVVEDEVLWCIKENGDIYRQIIGEQPERRISGRKTYISAGQAGLWGVNSDHRVYYRKGTHGNPTSRGNGWDWIQGQPLKTIAVGKNIVVGTSPDEKVYMREGISASNPIGTNWRRINGQNEQNWKQVDIYGATDLWGINRQGAIYRYVFRQNRWKSVSGTKTHITTGPAGIWGVNSGKEIHYLQQTRGNTNSRGNNRWTLVSGQLVDISSGTKFVVGVDHNKFIWIKKVSDSKPAGGEWGTISYVEQKQCANGNDKTLWCRNQDGEIHTFDIEMRTWTIIDGNKYHLGAGPSGVWGCNHNNDIWHRAGTYGQPESRGTGWLQVSGLKVKNIAIGVDVVVGTTPNDDIYIREGVTAQRPQGTNWKKISGKAKQCGIEEGADSIWCVNSNNEIYKYQPDTDTWTNIDGSLKYISAGVAGVWGVGSRKKINYRQGTYNATNFVGTEWEKVDGSSRLDIKNLAVGKSLVVATNAGYRVFFRTGIYHVPPVIQDVDIEWTENTTQKEI